MSSKNLRIRTLPAGLSAIRRASAALIVILSLMFTVPVVPTGKDEGLLIKPATVAIATPFISNVAEDENTVTVGLGGPPTAGFSKRVIRQFIVKLAVPAAGMLVGFAEIDCTSAYVGLKNTHASRKNEITCLATGSDRCCNSENSENLITGFIFNCFSISACQ